MRPRASVSLTEAQELRVDLLGGQDGQHEERDGDSE
jgi:hypothetical protein